jgi:hypothetical protein
MRIRNEGFLARERFTSYDKEYFWEPIFVYLQVNMSVCIVDYVILIILHFAIRNFVSYFIVLSGVEGFHGGSQTPFVDKYFGSTSLYLAATIK